MKNKILKLIFMVSKHLFYWTIILFVTAGTLWANSGNAQGTVKSVKENFISLDLKGATLYEIMKAIEDRTGYKFTYDKNEIDRKLRMELSYDMVSVEEILLEVSKNAHLKFQQINNNIHVKKLNKSETPQRIEVIIQTRNITGRVTSQEDGQPLPGVNVIEKGTSNGTVTNVQGEYAIGITEGASLVFSSVGYISEEVLVGSRSVIDLVLTQDVQQLDELVVVGYGTQKRSDLTGSVVSVKAEDFKNQSVTDVNQLLQGKVSGVLVETPQGKPGSTSQIIIRGAGSINGATPLYIIDGIRGSADSNLNPRDIESFEILKDAAAAAIYGAEAAHGVILITTKQGRKGKPVVNLSTKQGWNRPLGLPEMLDKDQYINVRRQAMLTDNPNAVIDPSFTVDNPNFANTDWVDLLYGGSGQQQEYDLSVSGGTDNLSYFVSANHLKQDGIMVDNWFRRYGFRGNTEYKISDRIRIGQFLNITKRETNPTNGNAHDLRKVFRAVPTMHAYDETNPVGGWGKSPIYFGGVNPLGEEIQNKSLNNKFSVDGSVYAEVEPIKRIRLRTSLGYNTLNDDDWSFREPYDYGTLANPNARLSRNFEIREEITSTTTARYDNSFGRHNFNALVGYEVYQRNTKEMNGAREGFPNILDVESFGLSTSSTATVTGGVGERRLLSQFGRINYNYGGKYLFQVNARRDGSNMFGPNHKFGVFPSISAGWNMHEESFFTNNKLITNLKLRASYGELGSLGNIPAYTYIATLTTQRMFYHYDQAGTDNRGSFALYNMPNADIKWETIVLTNIGVDFGILENKLTGTVEYYNKNTDDMIYGVNVPYAVGIGVYQNAPQPIQKNIGQMTNKGWDINLAYRDKIGDFNYNIGANTSFNKNEIAKLFDEKSVINDGSEVYMTGSITRTELNMPMGYFYGFIVEGIFQNQAQVDAYNEKNPNGFYQLAGTRPGDFIYRDLTGDGRITDADKTMIGNPWPKMVYGFNLGGEFKGIDFNMHFQGVNGVDVYHAAKFAKRSMKNDYNSTVQVLEAWTADNPTNHPRLTNQDPNGNMSRHSDYFIEDGSYLKLRNLVVGYSLPERISNAISLQRVRVYFNAQNVFTLTKYTGMDPELGLNDTNNIRARGIEGLDRHPQIGLLSFGLDVSF
jgi:TonB-dependent starch-binding outer membrane protein SusC